MRLKEKQEAYLITQQSEARFNLSTL